MYYRYCHTTNTELVIYVAIVIILMAAPTVLEMFFDRIRDCKKYNKKSLSRSLDKEKE